MSDLHELRERARKIAMSGFVEAPYWNERQLAENLVPAITAGLRAAFEEGRASERRRILTALDYAGETPGEPQ